VLILIYDQLLFRPLLAWVQKFKVEEIGSDEIEPPWFLVMLQRAQIFRMASRCAEGAAEFVSQRIRRAPARHSEARRPAPWRRAAGEWAWHIFLVGGAVYALFEVYHFIRDEVGWGEVLYVVGLGAITLTRVVVLIVLAALVWVPVGVWIGFRPRIARLVQPWIQFLAAFPANLFFPLFVAFIVEGRLNPEIWLSPLMILGTQWYILFNVIAGTLSLPTDYQLVAGNFGVRGWLWWRRLVLPGIFPALVTGAVTASGGSWNASIVAEIVKWGNTTISATGIGAYIANETEKGDFPRLALGTTVLCLFVLLFNRLLWRRLYNLAEERLRLD
jgi:NitT/TauT family transport system permease protein